MNTLFLLLLFMSPCMLCFGQNELKTKKDSIFFFEKQISDLKTKLEYGDDKSVATDGNGITCKIRKAYYEYPYIDVDLEFLCENDSPILKFNNKSFCLLAEKHLWVYSYNHFLDFHNLELEEGIKKNLISRFSIYNKFKGSKPRLIEYLKLTEEQSDQKFIFRNIPIDYDEDK